jgi:GNAT superfamily N-acetyltransferase
MMGRFRRQNSGSESTDMHAMAGSSPTLIDIGAASLDVLKRVADDVFDNPVDFARARACTRSPDYKLVVAVSDGVVIGQARAFLQRQPDDAAWLYVDNLGVTGAWKRKGVASALITRLVDWGRGQGATLVWLGSEPGNDEATGLYRSLGFVSEPMLSWSKRL